MWFSWALLFWILGEEVSDAFKIKVILSSYINPQVDTLRIHQIFFFKKMQFSVFSCWDQTSKQLLNKTRLPGRFIWRWDC